MTRQERFADEWDMPIAEVLLLVGLAKHAGRCGEHICNGDKEDGSAEPDTNKKHDNAQRWRKQQDEIDARIVALVAAYGFTAIEYCGLGPTLKRGEQFVEVPY